MSSPVIYEASVNILWLINLLTYFVIGFHVNKINLCLSHKKIKRSLTTTYGNFFVSKPSKIILGIP